MPFEIVTREVALPDGGALEVITTEGLGPQHPTVCAAHPGEPYTVGTAKLLGDISGARVVAVNLRGLGTSSAGEGVGPGRDPLELMVEDLERVRRSLGVPSWTFWGLSGGGWIAQAYAHFAPAALDGFIVESACAHLLGRLWDPACVLSPGFAAWREPLSRAGLLPTPQHEGAPPGELEWSEAEGVGLFLRERGGPAVLVAGAPLSDAMRRMLLALIDFDARAWLPSARTPALVIAGDQDPVAPIAHVRRVYEALPDARWVVVQGGGHVPSAQGSDPARQAVRAFIAERAGLGSASGVGP